MIKSIIDWAGTAGEVGRVYVVGWNTEEERKQGKVRVTRTHLVIPAAVCLDIAKKQLSGNHISQAEYNIAVSKINKV